MYLHRVHRDGDEEAQKIAQIVSAILNTYEDDSSDNALRAELASAIRPFASPKVYALMIVYPPYLETSTVTPMPLVCVS